MMRIDYTTCLYGLVGTGLRLRERGILELFPMQQVDDPDRRSMRKSPSIHQGGTSCRRKQRAVAGRGLIALSLPASPAKRET